MSQATPEKESLVFVFGTLKSGFPNAASNQGRRLPGDFRTSENWRLYLVGERHSPWLVSSPGEGLPVRGQLFAVDAAALAVMDRLERVQLADGYRRIEIRVVAETDAREYDAFAYARSPIQLAAASVRSGPFEEYTLEHAALYRPRPRG
ncbi:MAG: gamma-glutamylcyclotransferase family protein [Gammaproteobacteria bacterium]|nr:gamma-glutamylcyclotransferase family protein [Gammaproteobacteria bacterium]